MRVLLVNKLYAPEIGGIESVAQMIAEGADDEMKVQVLVCRRKGKGVDEVVDGVAVRRSGSIGMVSSMPVSVSFLREFRRLSGQADIVQLNLPFPLGDLACLLSGYRGKVVLWWHSDIVRQQKLMAFYRPLMHWILRRADRIVVATQGHIDGSSYLGPYADKCTVIPYGVDEAYYEDGRRFLAQLRKLPCGGGDCAHSKSETVEILFVGRLVYYKGCEVLLDAFARMREKNCRLTLIGDGPLLGKLRELAASLGIDSRVRFVASAGKEDMQRAYAQSDMLVLPSVARSEAFGLVQIEAMAYGKPVINTRLPGGAPHASVDGLTGLTVPPGDARELARAMDALASDRELREHYGENARRRVEDHFNRAQMLSRVKALYRALCNE